MVQHMVQDMVQHIRLIPSALKKVQPPATSFSRSSKVKAAPKKIWADAWANGLKPSKTLVFPVHKHKIPKSLNTCYSVVSKKALRFEGAARVFENSFLKLWEI